MKRKVYIFNSTSSAAIYGIGTYINQLIDGLKKSCIDFELIHLYSEGLEVSIEEKDGYEQISIPKITYVSKNLKYYARNVAYILRELIPEEENVLYIFHLNFMTNHELIPILRKMFNCKIIITIHYLNWNFAISGDIKKLNSILSIKDQEPTDFERQIMDNIESNKKMLEESDLFITVAQHTLETLKNICNIDISNGVCINNAIKNAYCGISIEQKNKIKSKYLISDKKQIVLFAGRLDEGKGLSFLLKAFKKVLETNPNTMLLIAGDGYFNKWLSDTNPYWTRILFMGRLEKEQLHEIYSIADVGVVCSLHEEFGYVAIEMMMHEIPLIVSDAGGLAEIVKDAISGLKIPIIMDEENNRIIDVDALTDKIKLLLNAPDFAKKIGENGRKRFLEKYELNQFNEKMVDLYLNI